MKQQILVFFLHIFLLSAQAQPHATDTIYNGTVTVIMDPRIEVLGEKMEEYYDNLSYKTRLGPGYRLSVINSSDRAKVMEVRSQLIQLYPEHKIYTIFKSPNLRLKFGNFVEKSEAEKMRKQLLATGIISGSIYVVPENVEIKPEKSKDPDED